LRCFGPFRLELGGREVSVASLKPRHRSVLHLLALRAGRPLHRDHLVEALWPGEVDARAAARNLQVAVSTVRQVLEPGVARGGSSLLVREADSYRLALDDGADIDLRTFERAVGAGRAARAVGRLEEAEEALARALDTYAGELLPGDGPAEWVVKERDFFRLEAADAAHALACVRLDRGRPRAAARAAERGVRIDRFCDGLWRLLPDAYERAGDLAAAQLARRRYREVLVELGLDPDRA